MWYFAYGSNLNEADFDRWCERNNKPRLNLRNKDWQRATLEGYALVFDCHSPSRGCEAANVRPAAGSHVRGVAFELSGEEVGIIAHKEGAPSIYVQEEVQVTLEGGNTVPAKTFVCRPGTERDGGRPSAGYLSLIVEGAREYGLDLEWIQLLEQTPAQETG